MYKIADVKWWQWCKKVYQWAYLNTLSRHIGRRLSLAFSDQCFDVSHLQIPKLLLPDKTAMADDLFLLCHFTTTIIVLHHILHIDCDVTSPTIDTMQWLFDWRRLNALAWASRRASTTPSCWREVCLEQKSSPLSPLGCNFNGPENIQQEGRVNNKYQHYNNAMM